MNRTESEALSAELWEKYGVFGFKSEDLSSPIFSVDTPPPYISATHLHAGHAMSFTQADIAVRYHRMKGYNIFYPMGFDDNGLPTERFVEKLHKVSGKKIGKKKFVELCLQETKKQAETYKRLFTKLGISVDWSLSYSTIDDRCQRTAQLSFLDLVEKGKVERKKCPVIWCPQCGTALAQSDLEDSSLQSALHTISFKSDAEGSDLQIATSRPEFLAACVAIFVNPGDPRYSKLIGKTATVPIYEQVVPIFADDQVSELFGTGAMMVCTWGDGEDVKRWMQYGLESREIISRHGHIEASIPYIGGLTIKDARALTVKMLSDKDLLVKSETIQHTVKIHERCETPIEYVMATQWFIQISAFSEVWNRLGEELKWFPQIMKKRYDSWIESLKWDWCISRQRYYGVPFPVWYCGDCGEILLPQKSDLPIDPSAKAFPGGVCSKCGSENITPEEDVMDTWMTSSLTPLINARWGEGGGEEILQRIYPMSLRVQAFEIIRTWLFYTIIKSYFHTGTLPWKAAMISGWGLDQNGKKISKSSGNAASAEDLITQHSADAIRYWASDSELGNNHRFGENPIKKGSRLVTKILNASKFAKTFLDKRSLHLQDIPERSLQASDRWILGRLKNSIVEYDNHFATFEYSKARKTVDRLFWGDFCDNYLEFIKFRLYNLDNDESGQSALATLYCCLLAIMKLYAPFIPFVTEEVYQDLFRGESGDVSIHTSRLPTVEEFGGISETGEFDSTLEIIGLIRKFRSNNSMSFRIPVQLVRIETDQIGIDTKFIGKVMNVETVEMGKLDCEPFGEITGGRLKIQ